MNNRELATFILLGSGLAAALILIKDFRHGISSTVRLLFGSVIAVPLAIFSAATVGAIVFASSVGLWSTDLVGSAVLWFLFVGFVWFIDLANAGNDEAFFRRRLLEAVGIGAFFEFFINIEVMRLWVELPTQAFLILIAVLNAVASRQERFKPVATLTSAILILSTLCLVLYTVVRLVADWSDLDKADLLDQLLMPIWLTLTGIVVLYPIALFMGYDVLYRSLHEFNDSKRPSARAVIGVAVELRGSLLDVAQFRGVSARKAARSTSIESARTAVREFKRERADEHAARQAARKVLVENTGVSGLDVDGLTLDRREFAETKTALRWLATCHTGWYNQEGRPDNYRRDLFEVLRSTGDFDFPPDAPMVCKVRNDGQAWYAYRRTPSGHVFGIGASGAPPSQWLYSGTIPPTGYPSKKSGWSDFMSEDPPEWRAEPPI